MGTISYNIGTAGGNGTVTFSNLEIDSVGAGNQITATAIPAYGSPVSGMVVWLDANNSATVFTNASGSVTNWADLSGNGNNFYANPLVTSSGSVWLANANTVSGRRTLSFPGTIGMWCHTYANSGTNVSVLLVTRKRVAGQGKGGQYRVPLARTTPVV